MENPATIWRKEQFIQLIQKRWPPSANIPGYESFPGTKTQSLSSAWSVARSLTPKNSATWRLRKPLNQRKFPTTINPSFTPADEDHLTWLRAHWPKARPHA